MHVIKIFDKERRYTGKLNLKYLFIFENSCFCRKIPKLFFVEKSALTKLRVSRIYANTLVVWEEELLLYLLWKKSHFML